MATSKETKDVAATKETKDVALASQQTGLAEFMDASDFGGGGFEGADADSFAIPFLQVLQKMSPIVDEDHAKYVEGAKAGMLLNSVTQRLYDGKAGLFIIPCAYKRSYVMWGGREGDGGFKGEMSVEDFEAAKLDSSRAVLVDGNWYVPSEDGSVNVKKNTYYADTRQHFVIVIDPETGEFGRAILSCASSQIKASRKLMTSLQQKKVKTPQGMKTPPTFANMVKVTTVGQSNDKGSWSGLNFELTGLVTERDLYEDARDFYKSIVAGEVNADFSKADSTSAQGDSEPTKQDADEF